MADDIDWHDGYEWEPEEDEFCHVCGQRDCDCICEACSVGSRVVAPRDHACRCKPASACPRCKRQVRAPGIHTCSIGGAR